MILHNDLMSLDELVVEFPASTSKCTTSLFFHFVYYKLGLQVKCRKILASSICHFWVIDP